MKREPLKRIVWRRVREDGTTPAKPTKTALRPHEEENVRAAMRLLHERFGSWRAVSVAIGVPVKTMQRVMSGERRVQDRWAMLAARALRLPVDEVMDGLSPGKAGVQCVGEWTPGQVADPAFSPGVNSPATGRDTPEGLSGRPGVCSGPFEVAIGPIPGYSPQMARRPQSSTPVPTPEMSAGEWLSRAPKEFAAEVAQIRAKAADRIRAEHEAALQKARELEAQLRELGVDEVGERKAKVWTIHRNREVTEDPSSDWSILRLVKHYLQEHPNSLSADVATFVAGIKGSDENVLSILYKYSRPGRSLEQTGERGSYRYSLREEAEA